MFKLKGCDVIAVLFISLKNIPETNAEFGSYYNSPTRTKMYISHMPHLRFGLFLFWVNEENVMQFEKKEKKLPEKSVP